MVKINCIVCGKQREERPYRVRKGFGKFCSQACHFEYNRKHPKLGENSLVWKEKTVKICPTCNKEFYVPPSLIRIRCCSHSCHYKLRIKNGWKAHSGYKHSLEAKNKMRNKHLGRAPYNKGIHWGEGTKKKMSESIKKLFKDGKMKAPFKGKHLYEETKRKLSIISKGKHYSSRTEFKIGHKWSKEIEEKRIKNTLKGLYKRPTSFEKRLIDIIKEGDLPYKYVGNGDVIINFQNPDFIQTNGKKKVIEVFYSYFKKRDFGSIEKYKEDRERKFKEYGFSVFFIDENMLKENNEKIIEDIRRFDGIL